jgi:hypothetical protein
MPADATLRLIRFNEFCRRAGFSRATGHRRKKLDPDFPRLYRYAPRPSPTFVDEAEGDRYIAARAQRHQAASAEAEPVAAAAPEVTAI